MANELNEKKGSENRQDRKVETSKQKHNYYYKKNVDKNVINKEKVKTEQIIEKNKFDAKQNIESKPAKLENKPAKPEAKPVIDIKPKFDNVQIKQGNPQQVAQSQQKQNPVKHHQNNAPDINQSIVSVVIPLFNEEDSIYELSSLLEEELNKTAKGRYEVIFIDDGSTDQSYEIITRICKRNRKFRAIRFSGNYGKSAALAAGFAEAKGVIVITMDSDLQDDPTEISHLISKLKEGYDLVSGWKAKRYDPITKTLPSKFFNFVTSTLSGIKLHDFNCGLKAYRREVVKSIECYGELHRYLPVLAHWNGFKVTEIPVKHHPRKHGKTKFGSSRFIKGFLDLVTILFTNKYFKRPMHFFGTIGTLLTLIGVGINIYLVVEWFLGLTYLSERPLTLFAIALIIVGIQFFSFGLLGELIVKNSKDKINYIIKEKLN